MGLFASRTYKLTNWAVLRDWPAVLVPVDIAWGVVLTGVAAAAGREALGGGASEQMSPRFRREVVGPLVAHPDRTDG